MRQVASSRPWCRGASEVPKKRVLKACEDLPPPPTPHRVRVNCVGCSGSVFNGHPWSAGSDLHGQTTLQTSELLGSDPDWSGGSVPYERRKEAEAESVLHGRVHTMALSATTDDST